MGAPFAWLRSRRLESRACRTCLEQAHDYVNRITTWQPGVLDDDSERDLRRAYDALHTSHQRATGPASGEAEHRELRKVLGQLIDQATAGEVGLDRDQRSVEVTRKTIAAARRLLKKIAR